MDIVNQRYVNFKEFIKKKADTDNEFIKQFMNTSFEYFISIIKLKIGNGVDKEKCLDEIFIQTGLKKENYNNDDLAKLIKYMEYFSEIAINL